MEVKETLVNMQPREKLMAFGAGQLTDADLLAALLGSGIKGKKISVLAEEVLAVIDNFGTSINMDNLLKINGLGKAKAGLICAAIEFSRRIFSPAGTRIRKPGDAMKYLSHFSDRKQEMFFCLSLNGAHEVLACRVVSVGLVNRTIVHPREVFAEPIQERAVAVIAAHNHPSGHLEPSLEDHEVTHRLKEAGEILGIKMLDHLIFSSEGYYSFNEEKKFL